MVILRRLSRVDRDLSYALPATNQGSVHTLGSLQRSMVSWLLGGALAGAACGDDGGAGDEHQGGTEGGAGVL